MTRARFDKHANDVYPYLLGDSLEVTQFMPLHHCLSAADVDDSAVVVVSHDSQGLFGDELKTAKVGFQNIIPPTVILVVDRIEAG
jgi:hypothetical protein